MNVAGPAIVRLERVDSTMDALHALAETGAVPGTAVVAAEQTAGRGSRGRSWISPAGGLWLSVLARPGGSGWELLSLRAGLAVAGVLEARGLAGRLRLKWPNDLMLDDRKVGGILCEARWHGAALAWVVVGLGLNVTNAPPAELAGIATCLAAAAPELSAPSLAEPVVAALRTVDPATARLSAAEVDAYARRDWLLGRLLSAPATGVADGIAPDGSLRVRAADGTITAVRAGTVTVALTPAGT